MEKQKIFWVILSVTVFVVVVLVVGLFLLKRSPDGLAVSPAAAAPAATAPAVTPPGGIFEFGRDAASAQGDTEVLRFVIGGGETGEAGTADASPSAPASAAPALTAASPAAAKPAAPAAAKPAATAAAKPAATVPVKPAAPPRGSEYWIQTGSYRSQTRAEELSRLLTAKGLAGRVFAYANSGETYFRVRIGPYTNKQEAEKFLAIVRKIQGLETSYISLVRGSRSLN